MSEIILWVINLVVAIIGIGVSFKLLMEFIPKRNGDGDKPTYWMLLAVFILFLTYSILNAILYIQLILTGELNQGLLSFAGFRTLVAQIAIVILSIFFAKLNKA